MSIAEMKGNFQANKKKASRVSTSTWHHTMGHPGSSHKNEVIQNLVSECSEKEDLFEACVVGKMRRRKFPNSHGANKAVEVLDRKLALLALLD